MNYFRILKGHLYFPFIFEGGFSRLYRLLDFKHRDCFRNIFIVLWTPSSVEKSAVLLVFP